MDVEVTVGEFFNEDTFVSNLASVLGIDLNRIRIVSIIAGRRTSSAVDMEIGTPPHTCCYVLSSSSQSAFLCTSQRSEVV